MGPTSTVATAPLDEKQCFLVGPLRTGSSLLARCVDDHPAAICLCESEINRALFQDYLVLLHCQRMVFHGLSWEQAITLLDKRKQDDLESFLGWYRDAAPLFYDLYGKYDGPLIGDKSPDLYRSPLLVEHLASSYPLIYTVRDPRSILGSIASQDDATLEEKEERWGFLAANFLAWKRHLDAPNMLVVRYEDLLAAPEPTMRAVYSHLGLAFSSRFLGKFARPRPERFLWNTAVDVESGIAPGFDVGRIASWREKLNDEQVRRALADATIREFMDRFGYAV